MSTFWAGRIVQLRKAGEPIVPVWNGFPRDISGFGILKAKAPHPERRQGLHRLLLLR